MKLIFAPIFILVRLFFQTVLLAFGQVWANKMRAVLTALGIIIGVGSVIAVVGGLTGMRDFILTELDSSIGARKMWLWGYVPESKRTTMDWTDAKVSLYEGRLIMDRAENIDLLTPTCDTNEDVRYGKKLQRGVEVTGIWPTWHEIESRTVLLGRELSQIDVDEKRQVCLINEQAIDELGLDRDPTGDFLLVGGRRFLIIGVLETKEVSPMFGGGAARTELFIPFETSKMMNPYTWTWFTMQLVEPTGGRDMDAVATEAQAELRAILRAHRGLTGGEEDTFRMEILQQAISQFNAFAAIIGVVGLAVVSISLLVGGIGIMNIMLVSVSERTREIGLRKALGAKPLVVLLQFLVEAVVLCLVGGAIGVALGYGSVIAMQQTFVEQATVAPWAVALALGFSATVGIVFGIFPAIKAARLNPIDALRHE